MRIGLLDISEAAPQVVDAAGAAGATLGALARGAGAGATLLAIDRGAARAPACEAIVVSAAAPARGGAAGCAALEAIAAFARAGGAVLGVGRGGFAALCRAGLLPGEIVEEPHGGGGGAMPGVGASPGAAAGAPLYLRVEGRPTPFTSAIPAGRVMRLPPVDGAGHYAAADLPALQQQGQIVLRRCDAAGGPVGGAAVGQGTVAGICNRGGNVVAVLFDDVGSGAGGVLLQSLHLHVAAAAAGAARRRRRG